jgi:hypothetical protein
MKKYFISFAYTLKINNAINCFANCVKTSLNEPLDLKLLRKWENEIKDTAEGVERVDIVFFKEIK